MLVGNYHRGTHFYRDLTNYIQANISKEQV